MLEDVSLDSMAFSANGKDVVLEFLDLYQGNSIGVIRCLSVCSFDYKNIFDNDDGFACYIEKVSCTRIEKANTESFLNGINFGFTASDGHVYRPGSENLWLLHVEGGEALIKIVCKTIEKNGIPIEE